MKLFCNTQLSEESTTHTTDIWMMFGVWVVPYMHAPSVRSHACSSCRHWSWLYIYIYRQPTYIVLFQINVYCLWISYHSVKYTLCMCAYQGISLSMITIRTISFISDGRCTYIQAASRAGRQVHGDTLLRKDFHSIQFYKWWNTLMCILWLQNSSTDYFTTVQSAVRPYKWAVYKWPTRVHYMS